MAAPQGRTHHLGGSGRRVRLFLFGIISAPDTPIAHMEHCQTGTPVAAEINFSPYFYICERAAATQNTAQSGITVAINQ